MKIGQEIIEAYQRDGAVLVKGLFADWIDEIAAGIEQNMSEPGPYAAENLQDGERGRFFDDYCNWSRIAPFERVIRNSEAGSVAAQLMGSRESQFFHDHVLVKEPGTTKATPWHQDAPYYFVDGVQTVSFWTTVEPVTDATLRCVAGSHQWPKPVLPTPTKTTTSPCPTLMKTGCVCLNGHWSQETRLPLISGRFTVHAAIPAPSAVGPFPYALWGMTLDMSKDQAELRPPSPVTA